MITATQLEAPERDMLQQMLLRSRDTSINAPVLFDVTGCSPDRMANAVTTVLAAHPRLHSRVNNAAEAGPRFELTEPTTCTLEAATHLDDGVAVSLIRAMADLPFDPASRDPLVRAALWTSPHRAYLGVVFSHVIVDFTAMGQFFLDVAHTYDRQPLGMNQGTRSADQVAGGREYYADLLSRVEGLDNGLLPQRRPHVPLAGTIHQMRPGLAWSRALDDLAFRCRVAPVAAATLGIAAAVACLSGRDEILTAVSFANRRPGDRSIRNTVNNLPLLIPITGATLEEDLHATQCVLRGATRFQSFDVQHALADRARTNSAGLTSPDTAVTFYRAQLDFTTSAGQHRRVFVPRSQAKFPFSVAISHDDEGYLFEVDVASDLEESQPTEILTSVFDRLLSADLQTPARELTRLPQHLCAQVHPTITVTPRTIPDILASSAERYPISCRRG